MNEISCITNEISSVEKAQINKEKLNNYKSSPSSSSSSSPSSNIIDDFNNNVSLKL
jgi:hypothetical protein